MAWETWDDFHAKFRRMGGIVEEFLEGDDQGLAVRPAPRRARTATSLPISTHDQVLGGPSGQVFLGCLFPAADDYRREITQAAIEDRRGPRGARAS